MNVNEFAASAQGFIGRSEYWMGLTREKPQGKNLIDDPDAGPQVVSNFKSDSTFLGAARRALDTINPWSPARQLRAFEDIAKAPAGLAAVSTAAADGVRKGITWIILLAAILAGLYAFAIFAPFIPKPSAAAR